jgi:hypothetical protein
VHFWCFSMSPYCAFLLLFHTSLCVTTTFWCLLIVCFWCTSMPPYYAFIILFNTLLCAHGVLWHFFVLYCPIVIHLCYFLAPLCCGFLVFFDSFFYLYVPIFFLCRCGRWFFSNFSFNYQPQRCFLFKKSIIFKIPFLKKIIIYFAIVFLLSVFFLTRWVFILFFKKKKLYYIVHEKIKMLQKFITHCNIHIFSSHLLPNGKRKEKKLVVFPCNWFDIHNIN